LQKKAEPWSTISGVGCVQMLYRVVCSHPDCPHPTLLRRPFLPLQCAPVCSQTVEAVRAISTVRADISKWSAVLVSEELLRHHPVAHFLKSVLSVAPVDTALFRGGLCLGHGRGTAAGRRRPGGHTLYYTGCGRGGGGSYRAPALQKLAQI
jgi:hypothetical protein